MASCIKLYDINSTLYLCSVDPCLVPKPLGSDYALVGPMAAVAVVALVAISNTHMFSHMLASKLVQGTWISPDLANNH